MAEDVVSFAQLKAEAEATARARAAERPAPQAGVAVGVAVRGPVGAHGAIPGLEEFVGALVLRRERGTHAVYVRVPSGSRVFVPLDAPATQDELAAWYFRCTGRLWGKDRARVEAILRGRARQAPFRDNRQGRPWHGSVAPPSRRG